MITGNRSMLLNTYGSLAWPYHCPESNSPLHTMNQCYDRIPIFYKRVVAFVDPITLQTYPNANLQNYSDRIKNLFQLDMDDKDSWFTIIPSPAFYGPKDIKPMITRFFLDQKMRKCSPLNTSQNFGKTSSSAQRLVMPS